MIYTEKGKTICNCVGAEEVTSDFLRILYTIREIPGFDDTFLHSLVDISKIYMRDFIKTAGEKN